MRNLTYSVFLVVLVVSSQCLAQARGQTEAINDSYKQPDLEASVWADRFEVEGREVFDLRNEIVAALGIETGQHVADVGAGTGLFVPLLAAAVGTSGKVYAVDIVPKFIAYIDEKISSRNLSQVQTVLSNERSVALPENSVDMVFTSDAYHHFTYYQDMLASIRKALRPEGQLIIVEYDIEAQGIPQQMKTHVGATKQEFTAQIEANGFELVEDLTLPAMRETFIRRFRLKLN